ncbi:MAG: hypothetical protein IRZ14_05740 [Chloroflexi bacterium]|nr:hypothetical protein [Chloroflexota bacterium]
MWTVTALISDPVKVTHALQKLYALGIEPTAVRVIVKDPDAVRALARRGAGDRTPMVVTGGLLGLLLGGAVGWMLGGSANPLQGIASGAVSGPGPTALVGLAVGLILGLLVGWLIGTIGQRRYVESCAADVAAGDRLLAVQVAAERWRDIESLLASYGGRRIRAFPS